MFMQEDLATAAPARMPTSDSAPHAASIQSHDASWERVTLTNGRSLHVRPVGPRDAGAEQAFVAGLSPVARFRRFHFGLNELPDALLRAFVNADQQGHVALVAEAVDDRRIVADARYVLDGGARAAEFAIAVSDAWQGLGLGRQLMHRLLARARRSGIERLCGDVLADNAPMLALMKRLGARLMPAPDDNSLYRVCLAL
jgi:GNAT superfamily N-acetyltransferase